MLKLLYILGCYLYGSLPVTEALARKKGADLRKEGTGKVGAGNLWQTSGAVDGIIGGVFDMGKGALPAMVAGGLGLGRGIGCAGSVAGLIAQMWPVFKKFDGGRGNSAAIGLVLALSPKSLLMAMIPMLAGGAIWSLPIMMRNDLTWKQRMKFPSKNSDEIPLGMLAGWLGMPIFAWLMNEPKSVVRALMAMAVVLLVRRITGGLSDDIAAGKDLKRTVRNKALYDRVAR